MSTNCGLNNFITVKNIFSLYQNPIVLVVDNYTYSTINPPLQKEFPVLCFLCMQCMVNATGITFLIILLLNCKSSRGRVVKAIDLKSIGVPPRRFESCRLRKFFSFFFQLSDLHNHDRFPYTIRIQQLPFPVVLLTMAVASGENFGDKI